MSVFDYLVTAQPVDPCAPFKAKLTDAWQMLEHAEARAFHLERSNGVLTNYAIFLAVAFTVPAITLGVKTCAQGFKDMVGCFYYAQVLLGQMMLDGQHTIQACIALATISSFVNAWGVKDGSWILPTDPVTSGLKLHSDWQNGRSLSLVRSNTSVNMVQNLETVNTVFAVYIVALFAAFMMTWVVNAIWRIAKVSVWVVEFISTGVLRFVDVVDRMIAHIQTILLLVFVNNAIDAWNSQAKPSNEYIGAALALHRVANEGVGGLVQHMVDHFVSNIAAGGGLNNTSVDL